jgi:hypothetical protein
MEKCRPHLLMTISERPYLSHCESTAQQQKQLSSWVAAAAVSCELVKRLYMWSLYNTYRTYYIPYPKETL